MLTQEARLLRGSRIQEGGLTDVFVGAHEGACSTYVEVVEYHIK